MVKPSPKQCSEAGIVLSLLFIVAGLYTGSVIFYKLTAAALILDLIAPSVFWPFAFCWFNLALLLGFFSSRILLSAVFALVIIPVAVVRKLAGKDRLKLKEFKKSAFSVFTDRNVTFGAAHLKSTY